MITVRNMKKLVGQERFPLLRNVNLHIDKGEFVAIIGAGGSGKTTLMQCMSGRDTWNDGDITYLGESLKALNIWRKYQYRKECAYLSQQPSLNINRTAAKNVLSGRFRKIGISKSLTGVISKDEHFTAYDYLDKVGLLDKAAIKAGSLSGGEKQRVAIGRALAWGAKVIYADDPVTGLDPQSSARVMEDFKHLCEEDDLTVICCLNNVEMAEKYCSRIMGLAGGEIVLDVSNRRLTAREKQLVFDA
jgi:phosphonate transport system ATP-binding protein